MEPLLEQLDPMRERLALQVGLRARHLHERELERKPRVPALAHVVDGDREEVDQTEDGRLRKLVCLLPQAIAGLLGHGSESGTWPMC